MAREQAESYKSYILICVKGRAREGRARKCKGLGCVGEVVGRPATFDTCRSCLPCFPLHVRSLQAPPTPTPPAGLTNDPISYSLRPLFLCSSQMLQFNINGPSIGPLNGYHLPRFISLGVSTERSGHTYICSALLNDVCVRLGRVWSD